MTNLILQAAGALLITISAAAIAWPVGTLVGGMFLLLFGIARGLK
jgi:hypothetical protein